MTSAPHKLGRYEIIRTLGRGAMGVVYEGLDPHLDRRVAIKTVIVDNLNEEAAADYEARFRTEARSAARLQHPHVVSVYDADRDLDVAFLVMEFVQGKDLKHELDDGVRYTLAQAVNILQDLLSALDYAHRHSIVHRDVKPANLLIQPNGSVKLADFGVARIQDSGELTRTQAGVVGTLKYSAPEQVKGLRVDHRADLFSAGVVLYQLLTGQRPFDGDSFFSISQSILSSEPPAPSSIHAALPPALDAVLAKALAKDPQDRYHSASDFSLELHAAAAQAPDAAALLSPSWVERGAAWDTTQMASPGPKPDGDYTATMVSQELDLVYWKDVKDTQDPRDLESYLQRFPQGVYVELAHRRIKRLRFAATGEGSYGTDTRTHVMAQPTAAVKDNTVPVAVARAAPAPTAAPRPKRYAAAALAMCVVVGAVAWMALGARATAPLPTNAPAAMPAAVAAQPSAQVALAGASAAALMPVPASSAVVALSTAPAPKLAASVKTPSTVKTAQGSASGSKRKLDESHGSTSAPEPVVAPNPSSPKAACEDRMLLGYQICLARECAKPALQNHPMCVERREMERKNQEAANLR